MSAGQLRRIERRCRPALSGLPALIRAMSSSNSDGRLVSVLWKIAFTRASRSVTSRSVRAFEAIAETRS
jgi:hypothetical protein